MWVWAWFVGNTFSLAFLSLGILIKIIIIEKLAVCLIRNVSPAILVSLDFWRQIFAYACLLIYIMLEYDEENEIVK